MALLGIDIGTSAAKAVLTDERGVILAVGSSEYAVSRPRPGWSEQDPEQWWSAACAAVAEAMRKADLRAKDVRAIGLSGQMHGSVLLDRKVAASGGREGRAVRPALLWNDQRTAAECARIEAIAGGRRSLVDLVGNAALTGFSLPKLLWIKEHEPGHAASAAAFLLPKDYIAFRLAGVLATDVGDASGTLLFDVDERAWSSRAIDLFGIDPAILPTVHESGAVVGRVSAWACERTGLAEGTPVVIGSGDNQAGAIGAGVVSTGQVLATLGTSGVIYAHAPRPKRDVGSEREPAGRLHTMCAADGTGDRPGHWSVTGCTLSAAGALQWARDVIAPGVSFEELLAEAATVPPGSGGLLFMPYLTGERCPHPDPHARGGWIGLTARHTRAHLIRAVIEGVTFTMGEILDLVRRAGVEASAVRLGGGGARSSLWRQMQADVYGVPVATTSTEQGPAFGAALLAGVGAGLWSSAAEAVEATISEVERLEPDPHGEKSYSPAREAFAGLYAGLRDRFAALGEIDRSSSR